MTDVENAYRQIADFLNNETEKTLLLCGIADEEKHRVLLRTLNEQSCSNGLIFLIHTTMDGIENFFHWAGLYKIKIPKKYGQTMHLSNLTLCFDKFSTKGSRNKYNNYAFDFIIIWPVQSITENPEEIKALHEMTKQQKTKKIIYLTIKEPWYSSELLKSYVDRVVTMDCENDYPEKYQRIMSDYEQDDLFV